MTNTHGLTITTATNSRFASGGLTCKLESLCSYPALVQVDSFVLLFQPERKAAKRYPRCFFSA